MSAAIDTANAILAIVFRHIMTAWPDNTEVSVAHDLFENMVATTPRKPVGLFLAAFGPRASLLFAKDPTLFDQISLRVYWDGLQDTSRHILWSALVQIYLLGLAVTCLPPDALTAMEATARSFADSIKNGHIDARHLTRSILQS